MVHKLLIPTLLLSVSVSAFAACPKYTKIHGMLDLSTGTLKQIEYQKDFETLCDTLPTPLNANLLIVVTKDKKKFETKIHRSFEEFWDHPDTKNKTWTGGKQDLKEIEITSFIPDWYKNSDFKIIDMTSKKVLAETKLK